MSHIFEVFCIASVLCFAIPKSLPDYILASFSWPHVSKETAIFNEVCLANQYIYFLYIYICIHINIYCYACVYIFWWIRRKNLFASPKRTTLKLCKQSSRTNYWHMGRLASSGSRASENLHYWTLSFPIEISGFKIIKTRFMDLQDSSQTGGDKAQPLLVEFILPRSTMLVGTLSDKFNSIGWKKYAVHDVATEAGYKACYANRHF